MLKKLSKECLDLTSYSRMRVDLAVEIYKLLFLYYYYCCNYQVLSDTVCKGFEFYGDPSTTETLKFIEMFDTFLTT